MIRHYLFVEKIPVRDIAELLGVSPQRVSQLLHEDSDRGPTRDNDVSDLLEKLEANVASRRTAATSAAKKAPARGAPVKKSAVQAVGPENGRCETRARKQTRREIAATSARRGEPRMYGAVALRPDLLHTV